MPVSGDIRSLSTWMKLALVLLMLGAVMFLVGFSTGSWMVTSVHGAWFYRGLWMWEECPPRSACVSHRYGAVEDYHKATQAMECIGLICMLLAFLLLLLYVCVDSCRRREAMLATIFFIFGAVIAMVIGFIIFATKLEERGYDIGWSMGVAIAGSICVFIAGIMCVLHLQAR